MLYAIVICITLEYNTRLQLFVFLLFENLSRLNFSQPELTHLKPIVFQNLV